MKNIIIISILLLTYCTHTPEHEFTSLIKGKTYNTWTFIGDILPSQVYKVSEHGKLISYTDADCSGLLFTDTYINALDNNRAIYIQHSPALPLYFAFILEDNGNEVFTAFNPDSSNTNNI